MRECLKRNEIAWVDDPSNEDEAYHRIRIRKAMPSLQDLGISKNIIGRSVANIQSAKDALEHYVDREIKEYVQLKDGDVLIPTNLPDHIPADILRRVWLRALKWVGNAQYAPRQQSYASISTTINSGKKATLHGCLITPEGSQIRITRELAAVANLKGEIGSLWDGRWLIEGPAEKGIYVAAIGANGLSYCPNWRDTGRKRASLLASPAVWRGKTLVAAPLAGVESHWTMRCVNNM